MNRALSIGQPAELHVEAEDRSLERITTALHEPRTAHGRLLHSLLEPVRQARRDAQYRAMAEHRLAQLRAGA